MQLQQVVHPSKISAKPMESLGISNIPLMSTDVKVKAVEGPTAPASLNELSSLGGRPSIVRHVKLSLKRATSMIMTRSN